MPDHRSDHRDHDHGQSGHDHDGHHHRAPPRGFDGAFALGSALNTGFIIVEVIYGLTAHSVACSADAAQ